jgi:hypothetical protein
LLLENNLPKLQSDIGSLEAKDRLYFLLKLSEFVLPKLQSIEMRESDSQKIRIIMQREFLEDE